jgi:hypothetical protein
LIDLMPRDAADPSVLREWTNRPLSFYGWANHVVRTTKMSKINRVQLPAISRLAIGLISDDSI